MFGGGDSRPMPMPPPVPDPPPTPPSFASASSAGSAQRSRSTGGIGSTILTSGQGDLLPVNSGKKSLLGW